MCAITNYILFREMKVYVVFKGRVPGVYRTWMEASAQVTGYPDNIHCSFPTKEEGEQAFAQYKPWLRKKGGQAGSTSSFPTFTTPKDALLLVLVILVVFLAYLLYNK
jgi:ribonuclease HI